ncbi:hypothetical protein NSMM_820037 [Nitrosomonas mobilis]|uniref:Uncharacterized protein n=1 Tax=Nitrosomonas mobilis TaxID=51642 RepID=A0A1G5SIM4_9PROT|nr:hypothetical protein NSMM_820037 [Nitrosomonas mobilis]
MCCSKNVCHTNNRPSNRLSGIPMQKDDLRQQLNIDKPS